MKISGCTIVRNAVRLNYPFEESVKSILPLCDEFIINCGASEDQTEQLCQNLKAQYPEMIKIINTQWETTKQSDGLQLRQQTDRAVAECKGDWCFCLQADEVVHEEDLKKIQMAIEAADGNPGIDGLLFDYLHFYGSYDYTIRGRNWYRREVRLFKLGRDIRAFRDAQGFRKQGLKLQVKPADARIFHYGYVRTPASLATKGMEMDRWWGKTSTENVSKVTLRNHFGLKHFEKTHPAVMLKRIEHQNPDFEPQKSPRIWNSDEIKNAITLLWESIIPYRIGEFKNYRIQ